jgi:hypothetical protein
MKAKILELLDLTFGTFDTMIDISSSETAIDRPLLIAEVRKRLAEYLPNLPPFDVVIMAVKESMESLRDMPPDPTSLPEQLQKVLAITKEKLSANRAEYEDVVVMTVKEFLNESDLDAAIDFYKSSASQKLKFGGLLNPELTAGDIGTIASFLASPAGEHYRAANAEMQTQLANATANWRNKTLEPHRDEILGAIGAVEPAPLTDAIEPPTAA